MFKSFKFIGVPALHNNVYHHMYELIDDDFITQAILKTERSAGREILFAQQMEIVKVYIERNLIDNHNPIDELQKFANQQEKSLVELIKEFVAKYPEFCAKNGIDKYLLLL